MTSQQQVKRSRRKEKKEMTEIRRKSTFQPAIQQLQEEYTYHIISISKYIFYK